MASKWKRDRESKVRARPSGEATIDFFCKLKPLTAEYISKHCNSIWICKIISFLSKIAIFYTLVFHFEWQIQHVLHYSRSLSHKLEY